jgi:malate dehydrogenase (quinone)
MVQVLDRGFPEQMKAEGWSAKLKQMIPSYGQSLIDNPALCLQIRAETAEILHLTNIAHQQQRRGLKRLATNFAKEI